MDKLVLALLLLTVSAVCARPSDHIKSKASSIVRTIGLYSNPFGWIGKPSWIKAPARRKKSDGHKYRWFIEIDESDRWWITVYDGQTQIPGPGKRTIMRLF